MDEIIIVLKTPVLTHSILRFNGVLLKHSKSVFLAFDCELACEAYYEHYQSNQADNYNGITIMLIRHSLDIQPTHQSPRSDRSTAKDKEYVYSNPEVHICIFRPKHLGGRDTRFHFPSACH
jgi:hypothetical protein